MFYTRISVICGFSNNDLLTHVIHILNLPLAYYIIKKKNC